MIPYDAGFLAFVASRCIDRPTRWWLILLAPLLAFSIAACEPLGRFAVPLTALGAVALAPRWAPVSLLLVVPTYATLTQSFSTPLIWLVLNTLFDTLLARLPDEAITPRLRGWPIRFLVLGVLYYTLLPLAWL